MDFGFTPEQLALRDTARDLFEKVNPPSRLRALWDAGGDREDDAWRSIADAGIAGLLIPEENGGQGGDDVDLVLVLEEAGHAALPEPIVETVSVAASVAPPDMQARIASGEATASVVFDGGHPAVDADVAAVLVSLPSGRVIEPGSCRAARAPSVDRARRMFTVDATGGSRLEPGAAARAFDRGATATAAFLNGVSRRLLEMTLEHVSSRRQFGKPVGSFQAVKHKLADMHVALESARPAAWYAAYASARGLPDASEAASVAKVAACEAHAIVNREALQCHAGIGFTWEHDLHLWLKRGLALAPYFGSAAEHRMRLARTLLEGGDDA